MLVKRNPHRRQSGRTWIQAVVLVSLLLNGVFVILLVRGTGSLIENIEPQYVNSVSIPEEGKTKISVEERIAGVRDRRERAAGVLAARARGERVTEGDDSSIEQPLKCNGVIDKTYWVTVGQYHNRFLDEYFAAHGWTRSSESDKTSRFIYPSFKSPLYKLETARKLNEDPRCLVQIGHTGNSEISRKLTLKSNLPVTLRDYATATGANIDDFMVNTWRLDNKKELTDYLTSLPCKNTNSEMWIFKKAKSARGQNIYLDNDIASIKKKYHTSDTVKKDKCDNVPFIPTSRIYKLNSSPWRDEIAQDYISKTVLVKNRKFHIRSYWIVASMDPMLVLYHSSYIMLASEEFDKDSTKTAKHITNNSVTKHAKLKVTDTHLSMQQFQDYLDEHNLGPTDFVHKSFIDQIVHMGYSCWRAVEPDLIEARNSLNMLGKYHYLATDTVITDDFKVKMIEWQKNPGMIAIVNNCDEMPWACDMARSIATETVEVLLQVVERNQRGQSFDGIVTDDMDYTLVYDATAEWEK